MFYTCQSGGRVSAAIPLKHWLQKKGYTTMAQVSTSVKSKDTINVHDLTKDQFNVLAKKLQLTVRNYEDGLKSMTLQYDMFDIVFYTKS